MTRMTATDLGEVNDNDRADWRHYKLSEPYDVLDWQDLPVVTTEYLIVSAADVPYSGPETYVFPADANGKVVDRGELPGSFRGALDHARAIEGFLAEAGERIMTRLPHPESQDDAPHPDARWNPEAWSNEGRWELPDGTPVPQPDVLAEALDRLSHGQQLHNGHAAALADRVMQLEAELVDRLKAVDELADWATGRLEAYR